MYLLGKISVKAVIPEELKRLKDIAYNLWWSWNSEAIDLYREIDLALWERLDKNPIRFLGEVSQKKLEAKVSDEAFMNRYREVVARYDNYLQDLSDSWFQKTHPDKKDHHIAYFSAEYGLHEVLPIYSGGLGVLSGDHCKSASDLGLPFTAVGLFYRQGYFTQRINNEGWQETNFADLNIANLPIRPVLSEQGQQLMISVELPGRVVYAKIWRVEVGRISIYLMDTDVDQNSPQDRWITARLYGGDHETRIQQEYLLGIGGVRVLDALGIKPTVYHMNEGHSAFLGLELIRKLIAQRNLQFRVAKEVVASSVVFTTHTPVPAGNDVFPVEMIDRYFSSYYSSLAVSRHEFLDLGLKVGDQQNFNMTVLALTLAGIKNGVSELHGAVSRNIFNNVWPGVPEDEVPIGHITNGIHTLTWMSPNFKYMYNRVLGEEWQKHLYEKDVWENISQIPDEDVWKTHCALKVKMIQFFRDKIKQQRMANGDSQERVREVDTLLDPNALTLGFARRFATYKRANLIFRDIERIKRLLNNPNMPVQIIFAGKAHPADRPAHEVIKSIYDIARQEGFRGKVIILENYNMTIARNLTQGVDIWLNNPRRPLEASGTSGQKCSANGVINFSVLDGWWCEGYNGNNGWSIGDDSFYENEYYQDNADSQSIYDTLEQRIIPLYYNRNENGVPTEWVKVMKESIRSLSFQYSTHRMLLDYTTKMYVPQMERQNRINSTSFEYARDLAEWKISTERNWPQVQINAEKTLNQLKDQKSFAGQPLALNTTVFLGNIDPSSVKVQLYYGRISGTSIVDATIQDLTLQDKLEYGTYRYNGDVTIQEGGEYGYTLRVIPYHPSLINPLDMGLIRWVVQ